MSKIQLLTRLIKQERGKICRFDTKDFLKSLFSEIYIPSIKSFFVVLLFSLFFFVISHLSQILSCLSLDKFYFWGLQTLSKESNHYQNLIAIHAGIGVIIFALAIFVAESLRDDKTDRARVLLRESFLFPLAVSEILFFFVFIWGDVNFLSILPVILIGIATIIILWRLITVLLNKYRLSQERAKMLVERLRQSIDLAIDERIGNNILLSKLSGKEIKLEFLPFSIDNQSEYYCLNAEKFGIISDFDLRTLKEIADIVDGEAKQNGFSFGGEEKPEVNITEEGEARESKLTTLPKNNRRYLIKKFHDVVDEEHQTLICIDKKLLKGSRKLDELDSLVRSAFVIKPADNFAKEVRYEISGIKDQFITAIKNKQLGKIEELVDLYIKLAEGFLEHITKCGGGYSAEQARKERHSLFAGWEQVRWLSSDIKDLFENSMHSNNLKIIRKVAYLPLAIARRAIEKNDHYLFQEFIWFAEFLYIFAVKESDKDLRSFLVDGSWRYLKEISDVYVEAKLSKDVLEKEKLVSLKDYGVYFFIIFQNLLKRAFDNKDFDSFEKFKQATQKMFDDFKPSESVQNVEDIKWRIEKPDLTPEQRYELDNRLKKQSFLEGIEKEIVTRRSQMYFGLASWILEQFLQNKTDEIIKQFYQSIQALFPSNIEEFTDIFLKTHSFEVEDFWDWNLWEMRIEDEAHFIQILGKLERFYAVKALSLIASKADEEIQKIELPHNRDLVYLTEGTGDLIKILDDIKTNPDKWKFALLDNAISKVDSFRSLLSKAKKAQEQEELESKIRENISQKKVKEFKDGVIKGFYESIILRDIFSYYKLLDKKLNGISKDKKARFGINIVEDKAAFFENWYIRFDDWGDNYGRKLASGENSYLLDEIAKDCQELSRKEFEDMLSRFDNPDDIILVETGRFFEDLKNFKPKWYMDIKQLEKMYFRGWLDFNSRLIPVFKTYPSKIKNLNLILNKNKLGHLIQLSPLNEGEDKNLVKDNIFYINVQAFSENQDLMKEFINNPPEWLQKVGDEQKQREHLLERVHIQIFERFEYNKPEDFEGYKLTLKD